MIGLARCSSGLLGGKDACSNCTEGYMSHILNPLMGATIGVIEGDARGVDYGSYVFGKFAGTMQPNLTEMCSRIAQFPKS